jgi:hypothetical protein
MMVFQEIMRNLFDRGNEKDVVPIGHNQYDLDSGRGKENP